MHIGGTPRPMNIARIAEVDTYACLFRIKRNNMKCSWLQTSPTFMKTNLRVMVLGSGLVILALCAGCDQQSADAQEAPAKPDAPPTAAADQPKPAGAKPVEAVPTGPAATPSATPVAPVNVDTNLVQHPVPPDQLKLTPALADVVKLVQAGVGEEVLMSYITNSSDLFNIGPDEILYLHDLGVSGPLITTLIQQDSTPEAMVRKQAANAVRPLPPGVALNKPAVNIFSPKAPPLPPPAPVPETAAAVTNESPAEAGSAPAIIYTVPTEVQQPVNVSYFYTELAPYGTWVDYPGYGRCWRPTVSVWNSSWRPYCDGGRWLWSDCGWYWYSDYTWGAYAFHYGRWTCPPGQGWLWVPDTCWGSAWVSWRQTRSHCAWAPLPPSARYVAGRGWYHNTLSVGADSDFGLHQDAYVALPKNHMLARRPSNYYLSARHAETVLNESSVANNYATVNKTVVNHGVGIDTISKAAGGNVRQVSIRSADTVGPRNPRRELLDQDGRTLTVARPATADRVIAPPARPITSLSTQRGGAANNPGPKDAPAPPSGPTVIPSGRAGAPIIMRGNGRTAGASSATSVVGQPSTGQTATTPGAANNSTAGQTAEQRAALHGGRKAPPQTLDRPRTIGQPVVAKPAPTRPTAVPQPGRTTVVRTEPSTFISQPGMQRTPGPAPAQPRIAPPAASGSGPAFRAAPSAPTVSPRVESYRAPSPAPAPRVAAPAQSSGGGSSSSRSSSDTSAGQRGSR
jgi:Family of unknown function (DUF6600)